jgi:hypothetical protein
MSKTLPVVLRPSRLRCASATLASGKINSIRIFSLPEAIQPSTSPARFFQTGTVGDVVGEAGMRQEERALGTEDSRIKWRDRSTGLPVEYHVSQRLQAIKTFFKGGFSDRIIYHIDALTVGESFDLTSMSRRLVRFCRGFAIATQRTMCFASFMRSLSAGSVRIPLVRESTMQRLPRRFGSFGGSPMRPNKSLQPTAAAISTLIVMSHVISFGHVSLRRLAACKANARPLC